MAIEIPRPLIEYLLLGGGESRRFIQDSPILVDVWAKYAQQPAMQADLLITSHMETTASELAAHIYDAIERPSGWEHDAAVAALQSLVAARLYFGEMLTILVPLTSWWHEDETQAEFKEYEADDSPKLKQTVSDVTKLPERWMKSPDTAANEENNRTAFERFVALCALVSVVALETWKGPEAIDDMGDLLKAANSDKITDTVLGILRKMRPKTDPMVWQISLNRTAKAAIAQSVPMVKADAARRLFEVDCSKINWAVVDTGIDQKHPALVGRVKKQYDFTNYRQIVSIGNKTADVRKANLKTIADARATELPDNADSTLSQIAEALYAKRPMPWDLLAQMVVACSR